MLEYLSRSEDKTIELGEVVGSLLTKGDVVALIGELGSGKTYLTKGIAYGLGVSRDVIITSPTFILVNEYEGRYKFYHIDLYRIKGPEDARASGIEEYIDSREGVVVIEWADLCPDIIPDEHIEIRIEIVNHSFRRIRISGQGKRPLDLLNKIKSSIEEW